MKSKLLLYNLYLLVLALPLLAGGNYFLSVPPYTGQAMVYFISLLILVFWVLEKLNRWTWRPLPRTLGVAWGLFLLFTLISSFFSIQPHRSSLALMTLLSGAIVFIVVMEAASGEREREALFTILVMSAGFVSLYAIYQGVWGFGRTARSLSQGSAPFLALEMAKNHGRVFATFINANALAGYLVMIFPLAAALFCQSENRQRAWLGGIVSILIGSAFLMTSSKSAWIGFAVMIAVLVSFCLRRGGAGFDLKRLGLVLGLTLAVALGIQGLSKGIASGGPSAGRAMSSGPVISTSPWERSVEGRISYWRSAGTMILDRPLWGAGPGTYGAAIQSYQRDGYYSRYAHNHFLQMAGEAGIPGAIFYVWFLGVILLMTIPRSGDDRLILAIFCGLVGILLHASVDYSLEVSANQMILWVLAGMVAGMRSPKPLEHALPVRRWGSTARNIARACLVPAALVLMIGVLQPYLAEGYHESALEASKDDQVDLAIQLGLEAVQWAPCSGGIHQFLASALRHKGDVTGNPQWYRQSLTHAQEAVRLESNVAAYRSELAKNYWNLGQHPQALEEFRMARAIYPASPEYANDLAWALIRVGQDEQALQELEAVREMQPGYLRSGYWDYIHFFNAHFLRAEAYRRLNDRQQAIQAYGDVLTLAEDSPDVFALNPRDFKRTARTAEIEARARYLLRETLIESEMDDPSGFRNRVSRPVNAALSESWAQGHKSR